jgi:hypothetical protein
MITSYAICTVILTRAAVDLPSNVGLQLTIALCYVVSKRLRDVSSVEFEIEVPFKKNAKSSFWLLLINERSA